MCAWRYVRARRGIDLVSPSPSRKDIMEKFKEAEIAADLSAGGFSDPVPGPFPVRSKTSHFKFFPLANVDIAKSQRMEGLSVFLVDIFDLLKMKLYAGGPRDTLDVAELVRANPGIGEWQSGQREMTTSTKNSNPLFSSWMCVIPGRTKTPKRRVWDRAVTGV